HPIVEAKLEVMSANVVAKIAEIRAANSKPTDHETEIEKDGIGTGLKAVNPFSGEELPVWVGNYVMMEYGTGAVMSVPAHDERDFEFAEKFGLPIKVVIERIGSELPASAGGQDPAFTDYGLLVNSGEWSG